ncbi:hypothetical protein L5G32_06350 [Gordonia sp. HY002]|uniref:hypothetical protein n=1 Tax=Gordonia zhenghanii TaxID=2911516 RepID=UPI001EEFD6EF|nr:hypothetical protein [Gordonia zhenghanii]MCF8569884.1 hypothetical protein [Gordonia zhenghanii]MCF8602432.1 hypothetical protein [Gordonia zhenghanii]
MLTVFENGMSIDFTVEDVDRYHGPGFPGGVAHGFCAMSHAVALLGDVERRRVRVRTAFPGPGGRDAVEMVLRAVTGDRFVVDPDLAKPERGATLARYVWVFDYDGRTVALQICDDGLVTDEFIALGKKADRTEDEDAHLAVLKREMTDRLLARPVGEVYEEIHAPN